MPKSAAASVTDISTGRSVCIKTAADVRPLPKEPEFIKLYIQDLARIFELQNQHQDILIYLAASADYDGVISLTAGRKERIANTVSLTTGSSCSPKSVTNAVGEYIKRGLIRRVGRGEYELDPHLFARGEWRQIRERRTTFQMHVTYSNNGKRSISTAPGGVAPDQAKRDDLEALGQSRLVK